MRLFLESILLLVTSIIWCEFAYYHLVFRYYCPDWPMLRETNDENYTRILVITDTHIMGFIKSNLFDKWLREWQMQQAYSISVNYYDPDLILFLGDIFDEGSISEDDVFDKNLQDFNYLFPVVKTKHKRIIIPGNHDVGFHDRMVYIPYLLDRFSYKFNSTSDIKLLNNINEKLNIVAINSMSFYNDNCPFCQHSKALTNRLANLLDKTRKESPNEFSAPILLTHIPLYRLDDSNCDFPAQMRDIVKKPNVEGKDVLHKSISNYLLQKLKPRLVLSGHTHMSCITRHELNKTIYTEFTLNSFNNKNSETTPELLLISANSTHHYLKNCAVPNEKVIIASYTTILIIMIFKIIHHFKSNNRIIM